MCFYSYEGILARQGILALQKSQMFIDVFAVGIPWFLPQAFRCCLTHVPIVVRGLTVICPVRSALPSSAFLRVHLVLLLSCPGPCHVRFILDASPNCHSWGELRVASGCRWVP